MPPDSAVDVIERRVLIVVELADPTDGRRVWRGVRLEALDADGRPINDKPFINAGGRFVWPAAPGNRWPARLRIHPDGAPFLAATIDVPAPAADPAGDLPAAARLIPRIWLRPSPAYRFEAGVTSVRGNLIESALDRPPAAVTGARVLLSFRDGNRWADGADEAVTDARGEFAVFIHAPRAPAADLDIADGRLRVRLVVTRGDRGGETRITPDNFSFAPGLPPGRVPEGQPAPADVRLAWIDLARP